MAETSNENARLRKFHSLLGDKYGVKGLPDYDKFSAAMNDSSKRHEFYEILKKRPNLQMPESFEDFSNLIGVPLQQQTDQTIQTVQNDSVSTPDTSAVATQMQTPVDTASITNNENVQQSQPVQENTQSTAPYGLNTPLQPTEETRAYQPYTERMKQQTAPINEMMQESRDLMQQLNEETEAYNARQAQFDKNYPDGWRPKNKAEQKRHEIDLNILDAQRNLLQARKDALGELSQVGDNTSLGNVIPKEIPLQGQFENEADYNDYVQQLDNANQFVKNNADKIDKYYQENVLPNMTEEFGDVFHLAKPTDNGREGLYVGSPSTTFNQVFNSGNVSAERFREGLDKSVKNMANDPKLSQFIFEGLGISGAGKKVGTKVDLTDEQTKQLDRLFGLTYEKVAEHLQNKIYQQYVDAHAPKNALDYILGSTMRGVLVSSIGRAIANQVSENQALRDQLLSQGYAEYGAKHPYQQIAAGVAPFVADAVVLNALSMPFTPLAESATAATATKLGKMALKSAGTPEAAMRAALANPVTGAISRFVGSSIPSAGGFAIYEALKSDAELYMDGNWHGLDEALDAGWEAAKSGAATGFILHAIGGATTELTKAMSIPWRVAGTVGGFVGTSEYFTYTNVQEQIEQLKAKGVTVDFDEKVDWTQARINGYGQNLMFMLTPSHIKGMKERFKSSVGKKFKLEWTEDDAEIIRETYGKEYWDLIRSLVKEDGMVSLDAAGARRVSVELKAILADPSIPKDTKAKLEWITTGRISALGVGFDGDGKFVYNADPESAVYKSVVVDYNGKPSVVMYDGKGGVLSIRRFKTKVEAEKHNEEIQNNILSNNIRTFEGMIGDKGVIDAARQQASGNGTSIEEILTKSKSKRTAEENIALDTYLTRLRDIIERMYSDRDAKRIKDNTNATTGTVDGVTLSDGTEGYVKSESDGTAVVADSKTGETKQIASSEIASRQEPKNPVELLEQTKQAQEIAQKFNVGTMANIEGRIFTIVDFTPDTGMPIVQIENPDGNVETREMTNEEVMAMSQQMQMQADDAAENETLDPMQKIQKAIQNGDAELLNTGMEELTTTIEDVDDTSSLAQLESMVARLGKDIAVQFKPIFKQRHKDLDGKASTESDSEEAEEQSQQSRLQEIRNLVGTINSEEELDNIDINDNLSDEEKQIVHNIIEKRRAELRGKAGNAPEIAPVDTNGIERNNVPQGQINAPTSENNGNTGQQTATIPIKDGEKMYESVSTDVTLADLLTEFDNDVDEVLALVNEHIKGIEKRNPKSMPSRVAKQKSLKYWQGVRDLLNKSREQTAVKEVETESTSEEPIATEVPVAEPASEEQTTETVKIPDFATDKSEDARARGYRMVNGERVDRQEPITDKVEGNETSTYFSTKDVVKGKVTVVEAETLQPSHTAQGKNPNHFLPEAQPKNRATNESQSNSDLIAQNMDPQLITSTTTAFNGAPVVNSRGEAIQGNNRIIALQKMWSGYKDSAERYKQYLLDNAESLGLDRESIEKMQNPVLVNMLDVDDNEAIRLGQFDSHDMESGAGEVFKPKQTLTKMQSADELPSFLNIILNDHQNPNMTVGDMIRRNAADAISWMAKNNFITQQQASNCYNNGALTTSATDALREMLNLQLFEGGIDNLDAMFDTLPAAAQGAIMSIMARDNMISSDKSLKAHIQLAIEAYHEAMKDEKFAEIGKDLNGAFSCLLSFTNQTELFGKETTLDPEKFNTFALRLAAMFKTMGKVSLRNALNEYYDLVLGNPSGDLFSDNENAEPMSASEAIEKVFGVKAPSSSKTNNNNGNEDTELSRSNVRNDGHEESEGREPGSQSDSGSTEQDSQGERRSDSGRGNEGDSREGQTDEVTDSSIKDESDAVKSFQDGRASKITDFKIENIYKTPSYEIIQYLRGKDKYDDEYDRCIETLDRRIADFRAREVGSKQSGEREREEKIRRILQIASAICEGVRGTEEEVSANIEGAFGEEKARTIVVEWAKRHNAYIEESEIADSSFNKEPIADTSESIVYVSEDGSKVTKLTYPHWMYSTLEEFAESIPLFNAYFEETAYQIKGVSLDSRGHLCVVMEQPFINGDFYGYEDFVNKKPHQDTRKMMAERGFFPVESEFDMYSNGIYVVSDVYGKNVCFVDGLPIIIDAHISRNEDVPTFSKDSFEYFIEQEGERVSTGEVSENTSNGLLFTRRKLEDGEECKVERIFRESNAFNFTSGETIETIDDVANIFKQLENSSVENAFICFVKNGRPTVLHLGMGEFASTSINLPAIKLAYDRMQPDSIYFVHNHPSGALRASTNDIDCAKSIEKACGMQPTNLIIDTTRGEYAEFNAFSQTFKRDFAENPNAEIPVNLFSFDKQVFSTDYDASKNEFASDSNSVAAYISGHRLGERNKLGALIINKDGGIIGNVFIQEPEITEDNAQAIADKLYDDIVTFGGFNAVIFGTGEKDVKGVNIIKQRLTDGDITLLDCVDIHKDVKGDYTYDSFAVRGVMDESTPSDSVETSVADESTPSTEEITDPRAIVPMPGETYSHLIKRINEAFKAGERLRKDHLNAAKQIFEERGEKDAKLIGQISDFIFGRMEGAGVQMWFETQESGEEGNGEFQIVGEIGASNYASARKAIEKAKQMEAEGKTPAEIREKTLCERGADGKWRLEIPDTGIMPLPFDSIEGAYNYDGSNPLFQRIADGMVMADAMGADSNICKLKDLMFGSYARVLFKMYPELANIDVVVSNLGDNTPAALSADGKTLYIWSPKNFRSNIIHEIQHAIQTYEGFSRGGDFGLFEQTPETEKADRLYEEIWQGGKQTGMGRADGSRASISSIAEREGFSSREDMMHFIAENSNYYKYLRIKGEVEARNVQKRLDTSRYWRQHHSLESTENIKRPNQIDSPLDNIAEFHLSDGTVYGWANADGIHLTMEGLRPDTMIHEYSHLWMAAMKANNPALYESLMRLAKNSPIWNEVVEDRSYNLSSDDAILSEVIARYSGREGERKMLEVTRKAIQNGADYKEKARIAAEYDRLANKLDRAWGWSAKFLGQDPTSFESMAEAADMLLMDIISGNNPNDGGYKPSGILKTPENGNPYFSDKNEYARGRAATSPSDVASAVSEWLNHRVDALQNFAVAFEEAWTDYLSSVRDLQLDIVKETGNEVHDYENAYLHAMHLSSVNKEEQDTAKRTHIEPLINAMNTVITPLVKSYENSGMSNKEAREKAMDDLERYMIAKHGEERNKNIARRDAKAKADKEFAPLIAQATAELKRADEDFNMGLISKSEHDAFENALNNLKAGQLIRENNLFAASRKVDKAGLRQTFEEEAKALGLWDDATDESTATLAELEKIARDFAQDFERNTGKVETDELWKMINALNALTLKKAFESGNMSKEIYDQLKNQYQFYVPLKGWHDDTADEFYTYTGGDKFSNFQPTAKKATGRTSRAGDILATMIAMNSSAILQGNKNLVKQKLFSLVQNNPTKLVTVSKTWYEKTPSGGWVESHPTSLDPVDIAEWERKMEDMQETGDARVGVGGLDISKNITLFQEREHEIRVNRGGREYVMYINGAPNPAQALNGQLNIDANPEAWEKGFRWLNRFRAQNYTSRNPEFLIRNLQKDILDATAISLTKFGSDYTKLFEKNVLKLIPSAAMLDKKTWNLGDLNESLDRCKGIFGLISKYKRGELDTSREIERHFQEFMENGGHTGYSQLWTIDEAQKDINSAIKSKAKDLRGEGMRFAKVINDKVELMNAAFEDLTRFATYLTSRQSGKSILISVADAKDASTNFNKKGSGAMGNRFIRDLILFANPQIQGASRIFYRLFDKNMYGSNADLGIKPHQALRATMVFAGIAGIGAVMTNLDYLLGLFFGTGDDDELFGDTALGNSYWKLSSYRRHNYINIPGIPLAEGYFIGNMTPEFAAAYGTGAIIAEYALGYGHPDQSMKEIASQMTKFAPIIGNKDVTKWHTLSDVGWDVLMELARSSGGGPVFEVMANEDFLGRRIHGYDGGLKKDTPEWEVWMQQKVIDEWTNGVLGSVGNINNIEHVTRGYFGGVVEFPIHIVNMLFEDAELNDTPVKVFFASTKSPTSRNNAIRTEFFYYKGKVDRLTQKLKQKGFTKQTDQEQYVRQHLDDGIEYKLWEAYRKHSRDYNSRKIEDKIPIMKSAIKDWRETEEQD